MTIESRGEKQGICPRKVAKVRVERVVISPLSDIPSVTYEIPEGADVSCDPNCPGAQRVRRMLGPIPLPVTKKVCPMPEEGPAPVDPSDGHNISMSGQ